MKIKKNGKVINLTESDIRKLSKVLITEQQHGLGHMDGKQIGSSDYENLKATLKARIMHDEGNVEIKLGEYESRSWDITFSDKPGSSITVYVPFNDLCEVLPQM